MTVKEHEFSRMYRLPGIEHRTLAGAIDGLTSTEVWMQTLEPGAETPEHKHDCEEVVVVTRGAGTYCIGDKEFPFGPNSTLIIPADTAHTIRNTSAEPIHLIAVFNATPANVLTPDGRPIDLPWSQPEK